MKKKPNVLYLLYITAAFAAAILIVSAAGKHELNIYTENTFEAGFTLECPEGVSAEIGQGPAEEGHGHFYVRPGGVDEHFPVSVSDPEHPERREIHPLRVDRFGVVHDEFTGNFSNCRLISALITIYVFACAAGLFIGFRRQTKYSIFSYNSVVYMGFGIFVLTIGITLAYGLAGTFRAPADVTMHTIYMMILNSAVNFLVISTPFLIVFAVLMIVSNLSLIRHEGKRLVNVLGIIVSVFFLGTDLLVVRYGRVYLAGAIAVYAALSVLLGS